MKHLHYYIDKGNGMYEPFLEYNGHSVEHDEFYARQLCTYFVTKGKHYELISNEMEEDTEVLILKDLGTNVKSLDEKNYLGMGIFIEFRKANGSSINYEFLSSKMVHNHWEAIRYLLKDIVDVPRIGQMRRTSAEIDEDRGCYVIYVEGI